MIIDKDPTTTKKWWSRAQLDNTEIKNELYNYQRQSEKISAQAVWARGN